MTDYDRNYEEFKVKVEEQIKDNKILIKKYIQWLSAKGLTEKTVNKHAINIDFYINEFLVYQGLKTPAEGISDIDYFLGYWFIRKVNWLTKYIIIDYCSGFKKFYMFMLEKGLVSKEKYAMMLNEIKVGKSKWLKVFMEEDDFSIEDLKDTYFKLMKKKVI